MRRLLVFIFLKDSLTLFILFLMDKIFFMGVPAFAPSFVEVIGRTIYTSMSLVIVDIIFLGGSYWLFLRRIPTERVNSFVLGILLHLPIVSIMYLSFETNWILKVSMLAGAIGAGLINRLLKQVQWLNH